MEMNRRIWLQHTAAWLAATPLAGRPQASPQGVERFPNRPITLWVPWPAGGATDLTLRLLGDLAARQLGQKVVTENRSGAGGTLVMPVLQQAAPDGYTIAQMPQPVFRAVFTHKVSWDPIRDTTPIIQISGVTFGVVVPENSPHRSLDDLFSWARLHPGELTVATNGVGTTPHVVMDQLFGDKGLSYVHVPYKGTAEQMVAVASGQVMVGVNSNGFAPFVDQGQLRLLVTFGERRTKRWPSVPTLTLRPGGTGRDAERGGAHLARRLQGRDARQQPRAGTRALRPGTGLPRPRRLWPRDARRAGDGTQDGGAAGVGTQGQRGLTRAAHAAHAPHLNSLKTQTLPPCSR
jgi:tripartite-type tricarboxylate transporter receptor subunit TctC